ncbi:hypothetical protein NKR19_g6523 [Coniochaeta hoffmannii]|uniref:DUF202 domain-containing protein n=1 Tax=Coniochaeta hoffmannii TaxID=91930 RepID=A0AA38VEI7_9PEZI|nr:hypothetical protein NKR19_g6523 [Coniochaeta hoffmannii]
MSIWTRLRAPVYQNTGSVARDHLASERTFLAWVRTGMGFVALGIAIDRFSRLDLEEIVRAAHRNPDRNAERETGRDKAEDTDGKADSRFLVGCLMALGSGSIFYGTTNYFSTMKALEKGRFSPSYHGAAVLGAAVAGLVAGVYGNVWKQGRAERKEMKR